MKSMSVVCIVAIVAFITYQLGVLESPPFVYNDTFLGGRELLAIVATTRERNIGQHVERLVVGSKKGIEVLEGGTGMLKAAAKLYDVDDKAPAVSTGVYFDDPFEVEYPRWAIGWAVEGPSFEKLQAMLPEIQEASELSDPIKVIRIGGVGTETFTARIPWRNIFTPMIAPMLHWGRGFQIYQEYIEIHKELDKGVPAIALEVYVYSENENTKEFIDYTVLFGDVANTWEDTFPGSLGEGENATEESAGVPGSVNTATE